MSEIIKSKLNTYRNGMRGTLFRQGKIFKKWKKNFFILEKKRLKSFSDESLTDLNGELLLDSKLQIYDLPDELEGMRFLFYLVGRGPHSGEEVMLLSAVNEKEKLEWIEALSDGVYDGFKQIFQPDLWSSAFYPTIELYAIYPVQGFDEKKGLMHHPGLVDNGNVQRPEMTEAEPHILLRGAHPEDRYALIFVDIDLPVAAGEMAGSKFFLQWAVINIHNADISSGEVIAPYLPPAPVYNTGLHRYFFLLFKQKSHMIPPLVMNDLVELAAKREGFSFMKWVRLISPDTPAAINGFYVGWDEYCDILHENMGYLPEEKYRSPGQKEKLIRDEEAAKMAEERLKEAEKLMRDRLALVEDLGLEDVFGDDYANLLDVSQVPGLEIVKMNVAYDSGVFVDNGNVLYARDTQTIPVSAFVASASKEDSANALFFVLMTDPDAPSRSNPVAGEFLHWCVANIPGNKTNKGVVLADYVGPAPPYNSGLHRYVFMVFKQCRVLRDDEIEAAKQLFAQRVNFRSISWILDSFSEAPFVFPHAVGIDAFLCEWEPFVDALHEKMGFVPPDPFKSPKQKLAQSDEALAKALQHLADVEEALANDPNNEELQEAVVRAREALATAEAEKRAAEKAFQEADSMKESDGGREIGTDDLNSLMQSSKDREFDDRLLEASRRYASVWGGIEEQFDIAFAHAQQTEVSEDALEVTVTTEADGVVESVERQTFASKPVVTTSSPSSPSSAIVFSPVLRRSSDSQDRHRDRDRDREAKKEEERLLREQLLWEQQQWEQQKLEDEQEQLARRQVAEEEERSAEIRKAQSLSQDSAMMPPRPPSIRERPPLPTGSDSMLQSLRNSYDEMDEIPQRSTSNDSQGGVLLRKPSIMRNPSPATTANANKPGNIASKSISRTNSYQEPNASSQERVLVLDGAPDDLDRLLAMTVTMGSSSFDEGNATSAKASGLPPPPPKAPLLKKLSSLNPMSSEPQQLVISEDSAPSESRSKSPRRSTSPSPRAAKESPAAAPAQESIEQKLRNPSTTMTEKCALFGITCSSVFEGEIMKKKFSKDFMAKESFLWIDPLSRSLHWGKNQADRLKPKDSKFISLDRIEGSPVPAQGEMKGILRSVEMSGNSITVLLDSGESLVLKIADGNPPAGRRAADWTKMLKAFSK